MIMGLQLKKNSTSNQEISLRLQPHPKMDGGVVNCWTKPEDSRADMCSRATSSVYSEPAYFHSPSQDKIG